MEHPNETKTYRHGNYTRVGGEGLYPVWIDGDHLHIEIISSNDRHHARLPLIMIPLVSAIIKAPANANVPLYNTSLRNKLVIAPHFCIAKFSYGEEDFVAGDEYPLNWLHAPPTWDWFKLEEFAREHNPDAFNFGMRLLNPDLRWKNK
jgi:hypothetical protein